MLENSLHYMTIILNDTKDFNGDLGTLLRKFSLQNPHFSDGRIDYTDAKEAAVVDCFVRFHDKLLILERSNKVGFLKNSWNMISGYLDEPGKTLQEKTYEEVWEETGIASNNMASYIEGKPYLRLNPGMGKTWYVFPVLVDLYRQQPIKLDWEHDSFAWIKPSEILNYDPDGRIAFVLNKIIGK